MQRNNLFAGRQLADIDREVSFPLDADRGTSQTSDNDQAIPERMQRHQFEVDNFSNTMKSWVLEEKGVMVY